MKWEEVRQIYPNKFVKMKVLQSHIEGNMRYIDDIAVIKAFEDNKDATRELVRAKDDILVYHTGKEKLEVEIKQIFATGDSSHLSHSCCPPISSCMLQV